VKRKAGIRELKNQTSRIVNEVRQEMAEYVITSQGEPVAMLRPFTSEDAEAQRRSKFQRSLHELKQLAEEIGDAWQSPQSAVELLDQQRR